MTLVTKDWMKFFANMKSAQIKEMVSLLSGMKGRDRRDEGEEALLQDHINALPDPPGFDMAQLLEQGRKSAGRCCDCGGRRILPGEE